MCYGYMCLSMFIIVTLIKLVNLRCYMTFTEKAIMSKSLLKKHHQTCIEKLAPTFLLFSGLF